MSDLINKREFLRLMGTMAVAAPTAMLTTRAMKEAHHTGETKKRETAFERVIRTNTLRCGYGIWEPGLSKDMITGNLKGIFFEYLEAIGKHTGLNIVWTEEVAWGDYPEALNSGRIDAMCFGAWPKANIAREVLFTEPTYYLPIKAYVREGDKRFDHQLDKINSSEIIISTMDSELSSELARTYFAQAKTLSIPQLSDASMLLLNVTTGKADVTFTDAWTGAAFMIKNPDKIREIPAERPLRLFGHTIPVAKGEHSLVSLLNTATDEIMSSGEFEKIVHRYETMPGVLMMQKENYS
ncbi:MAG: transporter substrate-binding domain-containing protein [Alphaproteobacteria bacterium]|nr:transporter substrate-binding domain-containing protein [Alphaproteobacteria bacterium]